MSNAPGQSRPTGGVRCRNSGHGEHGLVLVVVAVHVGQAIDVVDPGRERVLAAGGDPGSGAVRAGVRGDGRDAPGASEAVLVSDQLTS